MSAKKKFRNWLFFLLALYVLFFPISTYQYVLAILAYAGYNTFFYLDSLFKVNMHPIAVWSIMGLFLGCLTGVIVAVKKLNLSIILVLYPLGFLILVIVLMSYINSPHVTTGTIDPFKTRELLNDRDEDVITGIVVAEKGANVRRGPGTSHSVVAVVMRGLKVTITDSESEPNWYRIRFVQDGQTIDGWISKRLVELSDPGHAAVNERVNVSEGQTAAVNVELPAGMEVTITSEPTGAELYINGKRVGKTPYTSELSFGSHELRMVNRSRTIEETIQIRQGGRSSFSFDVIVCGNEVTFTYRGRKVTYGTIERGGLCWMDRNLGASRVPTSSTDAQGYGDLFQWGRGDDGHQVRTSGTTSTLSSTNVPGHGNYITPGSSPWDWRSSQNNNLWQGEDGINNPCPPGWRVPTDSELNAELKSWGSNNEAGAYASALKWPVGGNRLSFGALNDVGSRGFVWSSSVSGTNARGLNFRSGGAGMYSYSRAIGMSVRCVRDL